MFDTINRIKWIQAIQRYPFIFLSSLPDHTLNRGYLLVKIGKHRWI